MNFVLERDGLSACPDDPLRVSAPLGWTKQQEKHYERQLKQLTDAHFEQIIGMVDQLISGKSEVVYIGSKKYGADELLMLIIEDQDAVAVLRALMPKPGCYAGQNTLGQQMIDAWCLSKARELAQKDMEDL